MTTKKVSSISFKMTEKEIFERGLKMAQKLVPEWPAWKKNLLGRLGK